MCIGLWITQVIHAYVPSPDARIRRICTNMSTHMYQHSSEMIRSAVRAVAYPHVVIPVCLL
jgi:hypothetical protein